MWHLIPLSHTFFYSVEINHQRNLEVEMNIEIKDYVVLSWKRQLSVSPTDSGFYDDTWPLRTIKCTPYWKTHTYTFLQRLSSPWWSFKKRGQDQNYSLEEVIHCLGLSRSDCLYDPHPFTCTMMFWSFHTHPENRVLVGELLSGLISPVSISFRCLLISPGKLRDLLVWFPEFYEDLYSPRPIVGGT